MSDRGEDLPGDEPGSPFPPEAEGVDQALGAEGDVDPFSDEALPPAPLVDAEGGSPGATIPPGTDDGEAPPPWYRRLPVLVGIAAALVLMVAALLAGVVSAGDTVEESVAASTIPSDPALPSLPTMPLSTTTTSAPASTTTTAGPSTTAAPATTTSSTARPTTSATPTTEEPAATTEPPGTTEAPTTSEAPTTTEVDDFVEIDETPATATIADVDGFEPALPSDDDVEAGWYLTNDGFWMAVLRDWDVTATGSRCVGTVIVEDDDVLRNPQFSPAGPGGCEGFPPEYSQYVVTPPPNGAQVCDGMVYVVTPYRPVRPETFIVSVHQGPYEDQRRSAAQVDADPDTVPSFTVGAAGYRFPDGSEYTCS
jgi:hypothetical protein